VHFRAFTESEMKTYLLAAALAAAVIAPAHAYEQPKWGQKVPEIDVTPVVPADVARICGQPQRVTTFESYLVPIEKIDRLRIRLRAEYDAQCQVKMQQ
jgi:hypothetical protein